MTAELSHTCPGRTDHHRVSVRVCYPNPNAVQISIAGDIDTASIERVAATVWPRLRAAVDLLVLDLRQVGFLGVDALFLLTRLSLHARAKGLALRLVVDGAEPCRALHVSGLDRDLDCYDSPVDAVTERSRA